MKEPLRPILLLALLLSGCAAPQRPSAPTPESPLSRPSLDSPEKPASPAPETAPTTAASPAPSKTIVLAAVGDVMLGGSAGPEMLKYGFDYPFDAVRELLSGADIVFGNLEGPLTNGGEPEDKQYVFRSPPEKVSPALARAGFNVVSLANNHVLDYGETGLNDTIRALDEAGIHHAGAGGNLEEARRAATLEIRGTRFAFLAYSFTFPEEFWAAPDRAGTAFGHEAQVLADIAAARGAADVVVVSFHWGQEAATELRPYQTQIGRAAIEAGAAAVIGHHPHILQAVEKYGNGVILYSLGNFAFGSYSKTAKTSAIAMLRFDGPRLASLNLIPLNVLNEEVVFQPRPLTGPAADAVVARLQELSSPLGTVLENDRGIARLSW